VKAIIAAILWLAPHVGQQRAEVYAELIADAGACYRIAPLLIVAKIQLETRGSWRENAVSPTDDYGLAQLHVSATTHAEYRGLEHLLFEPDRNIWMAARLLRYWQSYHDRHCLRTGREDHPWWAHYQWGNKVRNLRSARRVGRLYRELVRKFRRGIPQS